MSLISGNRKLPNYSKNNSVLNLELKKLNYNILADRKVDKSLENLFIFSKDNLKL